MPKERGIQAPGRTASAPLTKADVEYAFRLILGREPAATAAIDAHIEHCSNLAELRDTLLASEEYRARQNQIVAPLPPELLKRRDWPQVDAISQPLGVKALAKPIAETSEAANSIRWFHSIDLGGYVTPGSRKNPALRAEADTMFSIPVAGKSVLDIGAWDGFFSFEAERRGASRVLATDWFCWDGPGWGTKDGFNFARSALKSRVEDKGIDPTDITPDSVGMFDVVILSGVIYHVRDPISVIERAVKVAKGHIVIETALGALYTREPAMSLLHVAPKNRDPTNWWAPNPACVMHMLKVAGCKSVEFAEHPLLPLTDPINPRGYFFGIK